MIELLAFISHVAFNHLLPVVMGIGFFVALFGSILCLHFNYHYFLIHGKILWNMASDKPSEVEKVIKLNGLKWSVGVLDAALATGVITAIGSLAAVMWPVTLVLLALLVLLQVQKFIFRGRHRKLMFELKLKGLYHD